MRAIPTLHFISGTNYYIHYRDGSSGQFNNLTISSGANQFITRIGPNGSAHGSGGQAGYLWTSNTGGHVAMQAEIP